MRSGETTPVRKPPVTFEVGEHRVELTWNGRTWEAAVDGGPLARTFPTQVEAWEAGVRTAYEGGLGEGGGAPKAPDRRDVLERIGRELAARIERAPLSTVPSVLAIAPQLYGVLSGGQPWPPGETYFVGIPVRLEPGLAPYGWELRERG